MEVPSAARAAATSSWVESGIAPRPRDLGAGGHDRLHEHRGLLGHVEAPGDAHALQGLGLRVLLAQGHQHGHPGFGPGDLSFPAPARAGSAILEFVIVSIFHL